MINLDGVVNRDALEALRDCDTRTYIRERAVDLVVDSEPQFEITSCALDLETDLSTITTIGDIGPILVTKPVPP